MITSKVLTSLLAATAVLPLAASTPLPVAYGTPHLSWTPCRTMFKEWEPDDSRSECTRVAVPVDYAQPDGRKINLLVSRIRATSPEKRQGVVLINPGGPGNQGVNMPALLSSSTVAGIGIDHDLIGFDPRGVGFSEGKECDQTPEDGPDPDPKASPEQQFRQGYQQVTRHNVRCAGYDPKFVSNLSTDLVARDLDQIRIALGEDKIGYYGISWGTALGAVYRSRFDSHVDRMLLDSVMPPDFSMKTMNDGQVLAAQANFDLFTRWAGGQNDRYHLGTTPRAVSKTVVDLARELDAHPRTVTPSGHDPVVFDGGRLRLIMNYQQQRWPDMAETVTALREGKVPPLLGDESVSEGAGFGLRDTTSGGLLMQQAVLCNDQGADPDVQTMWREEEQRRKDYPLFSWKASYQHWCAGWPFPAQPWHLQRGNSALQLVGHRYETVTPYWQAQDMQRRIGGTVLTIDDAVHGSLDQTGCGSKAVEFFRTGRTDNGTCSAGPA